jgi:hypothetical protein
VYAVHRSFLLSVQWVPARPLVVGWLALRLSACEFGSAGAGLHSASEGGFIKWIGKQPIKSRPPDQTVSNEESTY